MASAHHDGSPEGAGGKFTAIAVFGTGAGVWAAVNPSQVTINATDNAALEITGGLAINPKGEVLSFPPETTITLPVTDIKEPSLAAVDSPCPLYLYGPHFNRPVTTDYYLLAIASATQFSDTGAPHSGLSSSNHQCTSRYRRNRCAVQAVFRWRRQIC